MKCLILVFCVLAGVTRAAGQAPVTSSDLPTQAPTRSWNDQILQSAGTSATIATVAQDEYRIGPEDLIEVTVFEVPELSRTVRVSASGDISLPLVGAVKAAGLSPLQLEKSITELLRKSYVKNPQVSVFLREYRSDPVSVVGAVKVPGLYQIQTQRRLIELLAMAQGFSENAKMLPGRTIVITHKPRPHAQGVATDSNVAPVASPEHPVADSWASIEEVPIRALLESGDPKWNVTIYPGDIIKVVPAGTFYVAGDVNQPGGFALTDFDDVSAIQAVAMAGGTKKTAKLKEALIIRRDASGNRVEQKIDLKDVLAGKAADARLGSNDILFVPGSVGKEAGLRGIDAAIQIATGVLIWGR